MAALSLWTVLHGADRATPEGGLLDSRHSKRASQRRPLTLKPASARQLCANERQERRV